MTRRRATQKARRKEGERRGERETSSSPLKCRLRVDESVSMDSRTCLGAARQRSLREARKQRGDPGSEDCSGTAEKGRAGAKRLVECAHGRVREMVSSSLFFFFSSSCKIKARSLPRLFLLKTPKERGGAGRRCRSLLLSSLSLSLSFSPHFRRAPPRCGKAQTRTPPRPLPPPAAPAGGGTRARSRA